MGTSTNPKQTNSRQYKPLTVQILEEIRELIWEIAKNLVFKPPNRKNNILQAVDNKCWQLLVEKVLKKKSKMSMQASLENERFESNYL